MAMDISQVGPDAAEALHLLWERVSKGDLDRSTEIDIEGEDGEVVLAWEPLGLIEAARNVTTPLDVDSCREYDLPDGSTYGDFAVLIGDKLGLTRD